MEKQDIYFGEINLKDYINWNSKQTIKEYISNATKKIKNIESQLGKLDIHRYPSEEEMQSILKKQKRKLEEETKYLPEIPYSLIDMSFLSFGQEIQIKNQKFKVPKFGVYPIYGGFDPFTNTFPTNKFALEVIMSKKSHPYFGIGSVDFGKDTQRNLNQRHDYSNTENMGEIIQVLSNLPQEYSKYLMKSTDFSDSEFNYNEEDSSVAIIRNLPKEIFKKYRKLMNKTMYIGKDFQVKRRIRPFVLSCPFNAIIPQKTKKNVETAYKLFQEKSRKFFFRDSRTCGIYFITETKPENWIHREIEQEPLKIITTDPLVVARYENRNYFIDKFDTTPLEEIISNNYTRIN